MKTFERVYRAHQKWLRNRACPCCRGLSFPAPRSQQGVVHGALLNTTVVYIMDICPAICKNGCTTKTFMSKADILMTYIGW